MKKLIVKYAVLCVVLLLVGCGKEAEYVKVVPADADLVATFDCQRIISESGLTEQNVGESQKKFLDSFKKDLSAGEVELFDRILANPNEAGIDWKQKVYGFIHGKSEHAALVMSVIDAEKLKASILAFSGSKVKGHKFSDEDGFSWARTREMHIAINDEACILLAANGREKTDELKKLVAGWLSQSKEESFAATKYHDMLLDVKGEIGVYASMQSLPENISLMASMAYSEEMDIQTIKYLADVSFEKGQMVAKGNLLYEDPKLKKWVKSQEDVCRKLDGKSLEALPATTPLWFGVGIRGNDLYDRLLEHPTYGKELQNMSLPLDIEGVIRSIKGDVAFAYPNGLFVDVKNNEILKICVGAIKTMGRFIGLDLKELDKDQYEVIDHNHTVSRFLRKDVALHIGIKDDTFYLITTDDETKQLEKSESLAAAPWAEEVDDNLLFLAVNFQDKMDFFNSYFRSTNKSKILKNYFEYLTYSQKDIETNTIVLSFVDKEKNVIEQLLEYYSQQF